MSLCDWLDDLRGHLADRQLAVDSDRRVSSVDIKGELDRLDDASDDLDFALERLVDGLAEMLPSWAALKAWRALRRVTDPVPGQPDGYPPGALERHGLGPYRRPGQGDDEEGGFRERCD
jgi:hypothetical protein